ncbi:unnamed protein product [Zymoseptoria tritici ST99CH_1A5]|uniref:Granulins domain-containing protein n=1 Tax=Zymoseptoria tritici ST99CH_1A5 TaxID=1276529 RepID=A0A1Y6LA34_ZYMTR|nr:unnamed protein product [Zymoseptoria tritici ST99CH_1A5]
MKIQFLALLVALGVTTVSGEECQRFKGGACNNKDHATCCATNGLVCDGGKCRYCAPWGYPCNEPNVNTPCCLGYTCSTGHNGGGTCS